MTEVKLAPGEKTNTYRLLSFSLCISVTVSSLLISIFADSLSRPFSPQQWDKKWPALQSLTFSLNPPPTLCSALLPILSSSVFTGYLSSTCLRNVSEQHKRTKAWGGGGGGGRKGGDLGGWEEKVAWGKAEAERKKEEWREGMSRERKVERSRAWLSGPECWAVFCHHMLTCSITHILELFINPPHAHKMGEVVTAIQKSCLLDSVASDAFLVM